MYHYLDCYAAFLLLLFSPVESNFTSLLCSVYEVKTYNEIEASLVIGEGFIPNMPTKI